MKKILPLLLALLLLCSCSEARKNAPSESESPPSNSTEETAAADDLIPLGSYPIAYQKVYKKAIEKKGMRKKLVWGENGALNTTEEVPVIEYWITDENGNALIDQPFYEVNFSEKTYFGEAYTPEDYVECPLIRGCYEGNFYRYYFINGSFLLETYEESGDCSYKGPSANNTPFGYRYTRYYYDTIAPFYGLNDSEGNVLFEPVYTEGGDTLYVMDQISDKKNKEETWVENLSLREAINRLNKRERHIIDLRFYEGKTQMEVAQEIGISQAQVSRLEKNALKTMRNYLRA